MYVWANPGLEIRKTSDPNSVIISSIPFGEKILPDWSEADEYIYLKIKEAPSGYGSEAHDLSLYGKMVRVKYKDQTGFVYSGYLSRFPTFSFEKSFHKFLLSEFDTIATVHHESKQYERTYHSHQMIFKNGINYFSYDCGTGCGEATYIIPNISLQEAFLIAHHIFRLDDTSLFYNNDDYGFWSVWENDEYHLHISGSSEMDFGISIRKSYSFVTLVMGYYN
jgi:hypothetical protein